MKEYRIYKRVGFGQDTVNFRRFLNDVEERINSDKEIVESVKECNRKFYEALEEKMKNVDKDYAGWNILNLISETPRYSYIKHLEFDGKEYEAQIDALERTFTVVEV